MGNRPLVATAILVSVVLLASCASATQPPQPRHPTAASSSHRTADDVAGLARHVPCPPRAKAAGATREQLRTFPAVALVTCAWATRTYPHGGEWSVVIRKASDRDVASLVAAFDRPDERVHGACLGVLISGPPIMLVDATGKYVLARYPHDRCGNPQAAVLDAVRQHSWQPISVHRDKLIRSARSIATGCGDEAKDMLYYEPGSALSPGEPVLNRHPKLTLKACIYHRSSGSPDVGQFVRVLTFDADQSTRLRNALSGAGPPGACVTQPRFALIATPIYDKVGDADVAWVELGGCWRVYFDEWPAHDGQWRSLVGTADPAVIAEMLRAK